YLAGRIDKGMLFGGGAAWVAGDRGMDAGALAVPTTTRAALAREAYFESAAKAVAALAVSVPHVRHVVLSGRLARTAVVRDEIAQRIAGVLPNVTVGTLTGFAQVAKQAAQGAALLADGLAGGSFARLVETMGIREAAGTVLDHLHVVSAERARSRLGL